MGELSDLGAGANILKGLIGLGVLTLPYATKQVGWLPSIVGMALLALLSNQSIFFAVMSRVTLDKIQGQHESTPLQTQSRPAVFAGLSCFDGTVQYALGQVGLTVFMACVAACQLATVVAYLDVLADSAESYMEHHNRLLTLTVLGVIVCLLSMVKTLSGVSILSYVGLSAYVLIFFTLFAHFVRAASEGTLATSAVAVRREQLDYATWFGVSAFAFGGLPVALVVYDDMREPSHFFTVCSVAYGLCWLFYTAVAVLGFVCYGDNVEDVIYFNFEHGSFTRNASILMICLVLLVTYVLQMMPIYRCAEDYLVKATSYRLVRMVLVIFTVTVSYFCPSSTVAMTLGGTFAACVSAFIIPPVVFIIVHPKPGGPGIALGAILISTGIAGGVLGLYQCVNP